MLYKLGSLARQVSLVLVFTLIFHGYRRVTADPINITIDDQYGDALTGVVPTYIPSSAWGQGADCTDCLVMPAVSQAKDGTYHGATWAPGGSEGDAYSVDLLFNGSAIYVYGILANYIQYATTLTNLSFVLDGDIVGYFVHIPTSSTDYEYNVLLYGNSTLSSTQNDQHNLVINTVGTTNQSLAIFDYALRTIDSTDIASNTTSSTSIASSTSASGSSAIVSSTSAVGATNSQQTSPVGSHVSIAAVVGGVVGGIGGLLLCLLVVFCLFRRRRNSLKTQSNSSNKLKEIEPYTMQEADLDPLDRESVINANAPMIIRSFQGGSSINLLTDIPSNHKMFEGSTMPSTYTTTSDGRRSLADSSGRKANVNRDELTRQVEDMQRAIVSLQTQLHSSREEQPRASEDISQADPDLRRHIMILQSEVERLQASQEELLRVRNDIEAPPGYQETV